MRRSSLVTAITALLLSTGFAPARANEPAVEASTNFDLEAVPQFLERVASLLSGGFGTKDAAEVAAQIAAMDFESTREWTFQVTYRGAQTPMRLEAFMDDVESPDLYFFTNADLAAAIDQQMTRIAKERGEFPRVFRTSS